MLVQFSSVIHSMLTEMYIITCMWTNAEGRQTNISSRYRLVWAKTSPTLSPSPQTHAWTPTLEMEKLENIVQS